MLIYVYNVEFVTEVLGRLVVVYNEEEKKKEKERRREMGKSNDHTHWYDIKRPLLSMCAWYVGISRAMIR
jgi:hypothetical protein